ncbi:MAG: DUF4332 domain-containing protein [Myxococcales bacterium]
MSTVAPKSYSLAIVRGLTAKEVAALKKVGIDSTKELLAAAKDTRAERALAAKAGLTQTRMREAVNRADLLQVSGIGPASADLFENAGVNSSKELAQRNASALHATLQKYVKAHPELNYKLPSPTQVASLVQKAKALRAPAPAPAQPLTEAQARTRAADITHRYIDAVLFSSDPEGAQFREAVLDWRTPEGREAFRRQMHASVDGFLAEAEVFPKDGGFTFAGRLSELYTEVKVDAKGNAQGVYVEID